MVRVAALLRPPKLSALVPLIKGGSALLMRQIALNVAFVSATRMTQAMDTTGVSAAAYAITNQIYSLGVVVMLAVQATGATLVPTALSRGASSGAGGFPRNASVAASEGEGDTENLDAARRVADRLIGWSTLIAATLAALQAILAPALAPAFSTLPQVREAVVRPAFVSALVQLTNGPLFAGEGIMMGVGAFGPLALLTAVGVGVMVAGLCISSHLGLGVSSVWFSLLAFHLVQLVGTMYHHLRLGPLARRPAGRKGAAAALEADCLLLPRGDEVCVSVEAEADASARSGQAGPGI
uniref:Protein DETOXIFICATION n=1 Tax=Coccolithus braarudii TaxID=221442 RepID=A0A7S0Q6X3_9EUKA